MNTLDGHGVEFECTTITNQWPEYLVIGSGGQTKREFDRLILGSWFKPPGALEFEDCTFLTAEHCQERIGGVVCT